VRVLAVFLLLELTFSPSAGLLELEELVPRASSYPLSLLQALISPPTAALNYPIDPPPIAGSSTANARFLALKARIDAEAEAEGRPADFKPKSEVKPFKREKGAVIELEDSDEEDAPKRRRVKREEDERVEKRKEEDMKKGRKPVVIDLCDSD
jgi:hypothetical protein